MTCTFCLAKAAIIIFSIVERKEEIERFLLKSPEVLTCAQRRRYEMRRIHLIPVCVGGLCEW